MGAPYELRHSFVSILSERGMPVEEISRLIGHKGTAVTEFVDRHELRPMIESRAGVMDSVFRSTSKTPRMRTTLTRRSQAVRFLAADSGSLAFAFFLVRVGGA